MGPFDLYRMQQYMAAPRPIENGVYPNQQALYPVDQMVGVTSTYFSPPAPQVDVNRTPPSVWGAPAQPLPYTPPPMLDPYGRPIDPLYKPGGRRTV